jgi:hypothetical protein
MKNNFIEAYNLLFLDSQITLMEVLRLQLDSLIKCGKNYSTSLSYKDIIE